MNKALNISNCDCNISSLPRINDVIFIDIARSIYEIGKCNKINDTNLLNTLKILCDFKTFFNDNRIHKEYKKFIDQAVIHFTKSKDVEAFFIENDITRENIVQAIEWVIGAIILWSKYIRPEQ
jgi:hypothetical protein